MTNFSALYDSCVLYPAPLRDLLMYLALTDLFRAKWTDQIHDQLNKTLNQPSYAVSQGYNIEVDQNTQSETPNQIYQK